MRKSQLTNRNCLDSIRVGYRLRKRKMMRGLALFKISGCAINYSSDPDCLVSEICWGLLSLFVNLFKKEFEPCYKIKKESTST